jgi:hypothetical protein
MGDVIPLRIEMSEEDFFAAWKKECAEWERVRDSLIASGVYVNGPSAHDVSESLRRELIERGTRPLDIPRIWIIGKGWLIPR